MMDKIQEAMKIFEIIHGTDLGPNQKKMIEKMKKEQIDLNHLMPPEVIKMKEIWAKLVIENKIISNKTEINKILKKANQELKQL